MLASCQPSCEGYYTLSCTVMLKQPGLQRRGTASNGVLCPGLKSNHRRGTAPAPSPVLAAQCKTALHARADSSGHGRACAGGPAGGRARAVGAPEGRAGAAAGSGAERGRGGPQRARAAALALRAQAAQPRAAPGAPRARNAVFLATKCSQCLPGCADNVYMCSCFVFSCCWWCRPSSSEVFCVLLLMCLGCVILICMCNTSL